MPLLLKPAPTRLRLVLWALAKGLDEFPESPPPGLVTIPVDEKAPEGHYTMSGYRPAGARAIRIDMLERLADMLRSQDSRAGFEANPDMLSITGMTLEQFADLMKGLGYSAERGERPKRKPAVTESAAAPTSESAEKADEGKAGDTASAEAARDPEPFAEADTRVGEAEGREATGKEVGEGAGEGEAEAPGEPEIEVFYVFRWGGLKAKAQGRGPRPGNGKPRGKPKGKKPPQGDKPRAFSARPPKKKDRIDPDNPFAAALMGLKDKD